MQQEIVMLIYVILPAIPVVKAAVPGTFFWRPRLGIDLAIPTTEASVKSAKRTKENLDKGLVTLIEGYSMGLTVVAMAAGMSTGRHDPYFNPMSAYYYTQIYRWALRYMSLIPFWIGGSGGHFCDTHKVWKKRFFYMDELVPSWLRKALFFVKKEDWAKEELDLKRFKKYTEPAFGKHFKKPNKHFNNFRSHLTVETMDDHSSFVSDIVRK